MYPYICLNWWLQEGWMQGGTSAQLVMVSETQSLKQSILQFYVSSAILLYVPVQKKIHLNYILKK